MTNREQILMKQLKNKVERYEWLLGVHREQHRPTFIDHLDCGHEEMLQRDFYENYYIANKPLTIGNYPKIPKLNLGDLKGIIDNVEIEILTNRNVTVNYERVKDKLRTKVMLYDYIDELEKGEIGNDKYAVAYNENQHLFKGLFDLLPEIEWLNSNKAFVWLGGKGTITPWHYDLTNNLLLQIFGEKKILLIPSWDMPLTRNNQHVFCDIPYKDIIKNPSPTEPEIIEIILNLGQMVFIPVGWSHYVEALSTSLTLTFTDFAMPNNFSARFPGSHESPKL